MEPVRIQKLIAESGLCSRRAAELLIVAGDVYVNGEKATLGQKVEPGVDKVTVRGKPLRASAQPKLALVMHKPRGVVCSNSDPHADQTIFDLLPREWAKLRLFCAGRLDKDSEGLVILTSDGDLAHKLMHPSNLVVKRYYVSLEEPFPASRLKQLLRGVTLEGEHLKVEKANLVAMLLEVGEENAAVLLARSELADEIDTAHDLDALLTFGLEPEQVEEVARLAVGTIEPDDVNTRRRRGELEKTISRRWADLVDQWKL